MSIVSSSFPPASAVAFAQSREIVVNAITSKDTAYFLSSKATPPMSIESLLMAQDPAIIQSVDEEGFTFLHIACMYRQSLSVIQLLVKLFPGAMLMKEHYGNTPLHIACRHKATFAVIDFLLQSCPAAAAMQNRNGDTPLHRIFSHHVCSQTVQALVRASPHVLDLVNQVGETPLHCACTKTMHLTNPTILAFLLEQCPGGPVAAVLRQDHVGNTLLHRACNYSASIDVINILVQAANVNLGTLKNRDGETPLHLACKVFPRTHIVQFLLNSIQHDRRHDKKATSSISAHDHAVAHALSTVNNKLQTPLHLALGCNASWSVIELLLSHTPLPVIGAPDQVKATPLDLMIHRMIHSPVCGSTLPSAAVPPAITKATRRSRVAGSRSVVASHSLSDKSFVHNELDDSSSSTIGLASMCGISGAKTATKAEWALLIESLVLQWPAACLVVNQQGYLPLQLLSAAAVNTAAATITTGEPSTTATNAIEVDDKSVTSNLCSILNFVTWKAVSALQRAASNCMTDLPLALSTQLQHAGCDIQQVQCLLQDPNVANMLHTKLHQTFLCGIVQLNDAWVSAQPPDDPSATIQALSAVNKNVDCLFLHFLEHPTLT